ncbi:unnamed protein product [Cunninghamella echinulata]
MTTGQINLFKLGGFPIPVTIAAFSILLKIPTKGSGLKIDVRLLIKHPCTIYKLQLEYHY